MIGAPPHRYVLTRRVFAVISANRCQRDAILLASELLVLRCCAGYGVPELLALDGELPELLAIGLHGESLKAQPEAVPGGSRHGRCLVEYPLEQALHHIRIPFPLPLHHQAT